MDEPIKPKEKKEKKQPENKKKKGHGAKRAAAYWNSGVGRRRKLKHMLKSNRYADVVAYATEHGLKVPPKPTKHKGPRASRLYFVEE